MISIKNQDYHEEQTKSVNQRLSVYDSILLKAKFLFFTHRKHESKNILNKFHKSF